MGLFTSSAHVRRQGASEPMNNPLVHTTKGGAAQSSRRSPRRHQREVEHVSHEARYFSAFSPAFTFSANQRAMRPRPNHVSPDLRSRYLIAERVLRPRLRAALGSFRAVALLSRTASSLLSASIS